MKKFIIILLLMLAVLTACGSKNPYFDSETAWVPSKISCDEFTLEFSFNDDGYPVTMDLSDNKGNSKHMDIEYEEKDNIVKVRGKGGNISYSIMYFNDDGSKDKIELGETVYGNNEKSLDTLEIKRDNDGKAAEIKYLSYGKETYTYTVEYDHDNAYKIPYDDSMREYEKDKNGNVCVVKEYEDKSHEKLAHTYNIEYKELPLSLFGIYVWKRLDFDLYYAPEQLQLLWNSIPSSGFEIYWK